MTFDDASFCEPWSLRDKQLAYVFSLDVHYRVIVSERSQMGLRLSAIESQERSTYHVHPSADGESHEVPHARVVRGDDWMDLRDPGTGAVHGKLILQSTCECDESLRLDYQGIAHLPRGFDRFHDDGRVSQVPGTVCITTRLSCESPKYRWLSERELFGFGQVFLELHRLRFSVDLYAPR